MDHLFRFSLGRYWRRTLVAYGTTALVLLAVPLFFIHYIPADLLWPWLKVSLTVGYALLLAGVIWLTIPYYLHIRRRRAVRRELIQKTGWEPLLGRPRIRPSLTLFFGGDAGFEIWTLEGPYGAQSVRAGDQHLAAYLPVTLLTDIIDLAGYGEAENLVLMEISYVFIPIMATRFPRLMIRAESAFDRAKATLGLEDIDFESDAFSRAFYVQSDDRRFAYDIVTPQFMELLLSNQGWSILFDRQGVVVVRGAALMDAAEFLTASQVAVAVLQAVPGYVWERYRA